VYQRRKIFSSVICVFGLANVASAQSEYHHLTFNVGRGFTAVTGSILDRLDHGGNVEAGAGLNFNSVLGVLGTYSYQGLGITRSALNAVNQPDGSARVFTLTIDPKISIPIHGHSFYLLGGGGWLRRTVEFTQPTLATTIVFDPWWGYIGPAVVQVNQVLGAPWLSWLYLIVAGSIIAFTAYLWLIHHESPTKVGTYAYVNPVVAC
jgi:outer membrane protein with beta-barrel domain